MLNNCLTMGKCHDCGLEYSLVDLTEIDDSGVIKMLCPGCLEILKRTMVDKTKIDAWANEEEKEIKPVDMSDLMPEEDKKKDENVIRDRCQRCGVLYPIDTLIEIDDFGVLRKLCPGCSGVRDTDAKISQKKNTDLKEKQELERAKRIKEMNALKVEKQKKRKIGIAIGIGAAILIALIVVTFVLT